ncbi:MAG: Fe(3+) ABC transporter substrate-binding protein [Burkholderiales bacterium]
MTPHKTLAPFVAAATLLALSAAHAAEENQLNLYTARHYQTDEALYSNFEKQTGIKINRIEGAEDPLMERIKNEGDKSPADVFITVDAGRLWRADQAGLFQPIHSKVLESRIPAAYRAPDGTWYGFSARARIVVYNKTNVKPGEIKSYTDLADPRWKGRICARSSGHVYMLSLISSVIAHDGEQKAEQWAKGVAGNLAREPKGGDTDQLKAVAAGECDIAISNTYYFVRLLKSSKLEDRAVAEKLGVLWPDQKGPGVHMNISGGGVLKYAPHKENAIKFLEYLASDQAQQYFANGNNEWPVVAGVKVNNPELESLGTFKADALNVGELGKNQPTAQKVADRAGWK